jgi:hypothetical protein
MSLSGSDFWDMKAREQGMRTQKDDSTDAHLLTGSKKMSASAVCHNFFTLWPSDCVDGFYELDERLRVLSAQMVEMNANITLFVTDTKGCSFAYDNILIQRFNTTEELIYGGFSEGFPKMSTWKKTRYTRISDILRLCLAHKHQMSYLDSDVTFLQVSLYIHTCASIYFICYLILSLSLLWYWPTVTEALVRTTVRWRPTLERQ